jgi:hypothetical protein
MSGDYRCFVALENRSMDDWESDTLELAEILYWAEFCAWSALVMTPVIWWLQGPSGKCHPSFAGQLGGMGNFGSWAGSNCFIAGPRRHESDNLKCYKT